MKFRIVEYGKNEFKIEYRVFLLYWRKVTKDYDYFYYRYSSKELAEKDILDFLYKSKPEVKTRKFHYVG